MSHRAQNHALGVGGDGLRLGWVGPVGGRPTSALRCVSWAWSHSAQLIPEACGTRVVGGAQPGDRAFVKAARSRLALSAADTFAEKRKEKG